MLCPHCQTQWPNELAAALKFCGACGKPMQDNRLLDGGLVSRSADGDYHPGGALGYMTVLFADLAGFTAFSEEYSAPGSVWLSQSAYDEVRSYFDAVLKPAIELRGKKHTIQSYEAVAERPSLILEPPPFEGRQEEEWQILQSHRELKS